MIEQIVPETAYRLMSEGYRYIDVRTVAEFADGHPVGAVNVPVFVPDPATRRMALNGDFVAVVAAHFPPDAKLIIGCRSGVRSQHAAELLRDAGYAQVLNMEGGFAGHHDPLSGSVPGWEQCRLPVCSACTPDDTYAGLRAAARR